MNKANWVHRGPYNVGGRTRAFAMDVLAVFLKQGYYNYHYALNDTSTKRVDVSFIEGTHYQTRNDYFVYVYFRAVGDRHDSFVGFLKTSSKELF